jgi:hypothetical protein
MSDKRLELRADVGNIVLNLWRAEDDKTMIELKGDDGELTMTVNSHGDIEKFLKQSLFFIKDLGM